MATEALRGKSDLDRALVQQWTSFADSEILPAACTLTFPILGIMQANSQAESRAKTDLGKSLAVLDKHLLKNTFLVGERISLADIVVSCTLLLPYRHALDANARKPYPNVERWIITLLNQDQFKTVVGKPSLCQKVEQQQQNQSQKGGKKADKKEAKKEAPAAKELQIPSGEPAPEKSKDPLSAMPKGSFDMDDFKRFYSNNDEDKSIPYFWEKFDPEHYSIWRCDYKYNDELTQVFMSCNLIGGMYQRLEKLRKNAFASVCLFGENNNSTISGVWVWRGQDLAFELSEDWQIDYTSYDWKKLDPKDKPRPICVETTCQQQAAPRTI